MFSSKKPPPVDDEAREYKLNHRHSHKITGGFYELTKQSEKWKPDYLAETCPFCFDVDGANKGKSFSALFRRKHCVKCGDIGCSDHIPRTSLCQGQCTRRLCIRCTKPMYLSTVSAPSSLLGLSSSTSSSSSTSNKQSEADT